MHVFRRTVVGTVLTVIGGCPRVAALLARRSGGGDPHIVVHTPFQRSLLPLHGSLQLRFLQPFELGPTTRAKFVEREASKQSWGCSAPQGFWLLVHQPAPVRRRRICAAHKSSLHSGSGIETKAVLAQPCRRKLDKGAPSVAEACGGRRCRTLVPVQVVQEEDHAVPQQDCVAMARVRVLRRSWARSQAWQSSEKSCSFGNHHCNPTQCTNGYRILALR